MKKEVIILIPVFTIALAGCIEYTQTSNQITALTTNEIDRFDLKVYFCPSDNCTKQLYTLINSAHSSIHCALYDLDLPEIIELSDAKSNQIDVKIITDTDNYENIRRLNAAGSEKYSPGVGEPGVVPSGVASEDMRSMADNRQGGLDFEQEIVKQDERSALMHNKF